MLCARLLITTALIMLYASHAEAATIEVPGDLPNIQAAVESAVVGDTILLVDSLYTGVGNSAVLIEDKSLVLRSLTGDPASCIIDCADTAQGFHFRGDAGSNCRMEGITISRAHNQFGAGLFCDRSSVEVTDCVFIDCSSIGYGGSVYVQYASPVFANCRFENGTSGSKGAGIYMSKGALTLNDCIFVACSSSTEGGAIWAKDVSASLSRCLFEVCSAEEAGGAIYGLRTDLAIDSSHFSGCYGATFGGAIWLSSGILDLASSNFSENSAGSFGGAIFVSGCSVSILSTIFRSNGCSGNGYAGAVYFMSPTSPSRVTNCEFIGNYATAGGALVFSRETGANVENCLFDSNIATAHGGAVYTSSTQLSMNNCTLSGNQAAFGGSAIYANSNEEPGCEIAIDQCIIAFSPAGQPVYQSFMDSVALSCTDVFGNSEGDWVGPLSSQAGLNGNFSAEPGFCDPLNGDFGLADSSPCADSNSTCLELIGAFPVNCISTGVNPDPGAASLPNRLKVLGCYPNPFNPTTTIVFHIPSRSVVRLEIYDILGREVTTALDRKCDAGSQSITWNGRDADGRTLASGIYFFRLTADDQSATGKLVLLK